MPSLLEPPSEDQLRLLHVIADGWQRAGERWPIWQYVDLRLRAEGLAAEDILRGLPTWQHNYRSVYSEQGGIPAPHHPVGLTIHGMFHANRVGTDLLSEAFMYVLMAAEEAQRKIVPDPRTPVGITVTIDQLIAVRLMHNAPPTAVHRRRRRARRVGRAVSGDPGPRSTPCDGSRHDTGRRI